MNRSHVADFTFFLSLARHRNFRQAGLELGVSASALSHALKALEARLGVRLLNRTNRSVTLTAAGEQLRDAIEKPFAQITEAVEALNCFRDAPAGRIRLNSIVDAVPLILKPVLPIFAERYPDIHIDLSASNRMVDVVGAGFDAGIRHGGTVPEDMIAQRISADLRWVVAASPSYLERFGTPSHPDELKDHRCIGVRLGDDRLYRWEFADAEGQEFAVDTPGQFTVDEIGGILAFALGGLGLVYGEYSTLSPYRDRGELVFVLEDWSTTSEGYHIYYSGRRQLPVGLKLLIDLIREVQPLGL
jgi:DNA-binding transcriptional LysR family regulator